MTYILKTLNPSFKYTFKIFLIVIILCFSLSILIRFNQYRIWNKTPDSYFVQNTPIMTTADAYHWIKKAKQFIKSGDSLKIDPQFNIPLLSYLLAKLSSLTGMDLYKTGIYLIPVLASLFIIPLSLYFFHAGCPACGITGSLIGTFNHIFLVRTSIGRVDTDALNIFFPFLTSYFILTSTLSKKNSIVVISSALAGISMFIFNWWYGRSFTLVYVYFVTLLLSLLVNRVSFGKTVSSLAAYTLFSNPVYYYNYIFTLSALIPTHLKFVILLTFILLLFLYIKMPKKTYILKIITILTLIYFLYLNFERIHQKIASLFTSQFLKIFSLTNETTRNILLDTVTETMSTPFMKMLSYIYNIPLLSIAGLLFFILFSFIHWKKVIPLLPLFALGLFAFKGSNRFVMFLAPFIGIGYGYLITLILQIIFRESGAKHYLKEISIYSLSLFFFLSISMKDAVSYIPSPTISPEIYSTLLDLQKNLNEKSVIITWWDYGWLIEEITNAETFISGGASVTSSYTYVLANALMSNRQEELFMINQGGIEEGAYFYLLFTEDMTGKIRAIKYISNPSKKEFTDYVALICSGANNEIIKCGDKVININRGVINSKIPVKKILLINQEGYTEYERTYAHESTLYIQFIKQRNNSLEVNLLNEKLFNSNFNQLYISGKYDHTLFEEVYNNYPTARMFRIRK